MGLWFYECQWKLNISVGHYEKIEKWPPFHKYQSYKKILNYQPPPKSGSLVFQCRRKWNISISHYEKIEKWPPFHEHQLYVKFSNYQPTPKSLGLQFSKCQWKWNISINHYEKIEKLSPFCKYQSCRKISNYNPPPSQSLGLFFCVDRNGILVLAIIKELKNDRHFMNINHMEKFQITDPAPKVGVSGFPSVDHYEKIEKWLPFCKYRKISNIPQESPIYTS